jgi:hypothetical protein
MIVTREVPRVEWRSVLDDLSRLHAGATASLEVLDAEHGLQTHGDGFTLLGLSADGATGGPIAAILAGRAHLTHLIEHPRAMHVETLWEQRTANLNIAQADGTRTIIRLGPPVLPRGRDRALARLSDNRGSSEP